MPAEHKKTYIVFDDNCGGETIALAKVFEVFSASQPNLVKSIRFQRLATFGLKDFLFQDCILKSAKVFRMIYSDSGLVVSSNPWYLLISLLFGKILKTTLVYWHQGNRLSSVTLSGHAESLGQLILFKMEKFFLRFVIIKVGWVVVPDDLVKKYFAKNLGIDNFKNFLVIPNGVDVKKFLFAKKDKNLTKAITYAKTNRYILYVGRMVIEKGIIELIQSLAYLPSNVHLLMAIKSLDSLENNSLYLQYKDLQLKNGLVDRIHWVVNHPHIEQVYQYADVVVLPSKREVFPLVMLEAAAAKKIFLGTSAGVMGKVLKSVNKSLVINQVTGRELAKKIKMVFSLSKKSNKILINKLFHIAQLYDWNKLSEKILSIQ